MLRSTLKLLSVDCTARKEEMKYHGGATVASQALLSKMPAHHSIWHRSYSVPVGSSAGGADLTSFEPPVQAFCMVAVTTRQQDIGIALQTNAALNLRQQMVDVTQGVSARAPVPGE